MEARAYPFDRLPRVGRAELARLRAVARTLPAGVSARLASEAALLLGAALTVTPRAPELLSRDALCAGLLDPLCALQLELGGEARPRFLLVELNAQSAATLIDRVLGGDGRVVAPIGRALDDLSLGVLGYLSARLCAAGDGTVQLRSIETSRAAVLPVLSGTQVLCWPLELSLAGVALGTARALFPDATVDALSRRSVTPTSTPRALAELPMVICAHAGSATLTRAELDALAPLDLVIPDRCRLAREAGGGYGGELELHVAGSRTRFSCRLEATRLTIEQPFVRGEGIMTDTKRISTPASDANSELALAADAPIELCLEVARFSLPLRELSALRPGEVLNTGGAIGATVTLSAAGRPLARGELVDVDGEVGMRVLEVLR